MRIESFGALALIALSLSLGCGSDRFESAFDSAEGSTTKVALGPREAKRSTSRSATVELPIRANGMVRLEDDTSHLSLGFSLRGAEDVAREMADGVVRYPKALSGSDVVHRVGAEGTEDFVVFEAKPARESIAYDVDVSRVAGLRLVSNTLEFLDEGGAPRLRIAPPYVIDARGVRLGAWLSIEGCAFDASPRAPFRRPTTPAGAASCVVRVDWAAASYPAIVDPSWVATGGMTSGREYPAATLLASGQVLITGGNELLPAVADLYDPLAGTFAVTGSMSEWRENHTATLLSSGKVLVTGGCADASAEVYDPATGMFALTGPMSTSRKAHTATLLASGEVLVAGGFLNPSVLSTAELYEEAAGTFSPPVMMAAARAEHTATLLGSGNVLVTGGTTLPSGTLSSAEVYDAAANAFTPTGAMASQRLNHTATLLGSGKVLVAGGDGGLSAELYDPMAGKFGATGPMTTQFASHTATLLASGKVLLAGGLSAELYDPTGSGTFTATSAMTTSRRFHKAALLGSGKVLVAGGTDGAVELQSAELYDLGAIGAACAVDDDCVSDHCNQHCCTVACSGTCMTCTANAGTCVKVTSGDDPDTCTGANACDATGVCRLADGQSAAAPATCASGFVSDGVCCDTACAGPCDACNLAGNIGTCSPLPAGNPGSPACGAAVCDGVNPSCPSMCTSDSGCAPSDYCGASGTCQSRKPQGASCNDTAGADCLVSGCLDCATGHCADGVCCDKACDTTCVVCLAALQEPAGGGVPQDGVCGPALQYTNPHNDVCPTTGDPCGPDGQCSGSGSCNQSAKAGTSCGASSCVGSDVTGHICDGSGTCNANGSKHCDPSACANGSCTSGCAKDGDCAADGYCSVAGKCEKKKDPGLKLTCTAKDQCATGYCVDGYCCDSACTNQCEACDVSQAEGTCAPVAGPPHGDRTPCDQGTMNEPCSAATCSGNRMSCTGHVGSEISCRDAVCTEGIATIAGHCNAAGACESLQTEKCQPFACAGTACGTTCHADVDCASSYHCDTASKQCISGVTCDGDHTLTQADGTTKDCSPYKCTADGACGDACGSTLDCIQTYACSADGKCVLPDAGQSPDAGGGCGCAVPGSSSELPSVSVVAALLLLARRRRARSSVVQRSRSRGRSGAEP